MKKSDFSLEQNKGGGEFLNEREIYEYLKKVNLMDLLDLIIRNSNYENRYENVEVYYTSNDLYRLYPNIFSKFKLDKYIKEENLPCIKEGRERIFLKSDIDDWLKRRCELEYAEVKRKSEQQYNEVMRRYE